MLHEFIQPRWFYGKQGFDQELEDKYRPEGVGINVPKLKILLNQASESNELSDFFKAFPYVKDLLILDRVLYSKILTPEDIEIFNQILAEYINAIETYKIVFPLLVLKEHIYLMLDDPRFDENFYKLYMKGGARCIQDKKLSEVKNKVSKTALTFLSVSIEQDIPYALRQSKEFKIFNWNAFHGLYRNLKAIDKDILFCSIRELQLYLDDLILFQLGKLNLEEIYKADLTALELVSAQNNIKPAFIIIGYYLQITDKIVEDTIPSRLAILRSITAVGEAIKSIEHLLPEEYKKFLEVIVNLRDHIIHSETYESSKYMKNLLNSGAYNLTLFTILPVLQSLHKFLMELKDYLINDDPTASYPKIT